MKSFGVNRLFFLLSYLIIGILVVSFFSVAMDINHVVFMNSDTLYMPTIYKDLFEDGNGVLGWNFNSAPNFFPEMLLYMIVRFFSGDFLTANVVYGVVQVWLILGMVNLIFKSLVPKRHLVISTFANLLFSLCFLMVHYARIIDIPFYLTTTAYHTGAFILQLAAMYLILELYKTYDRSKAILLFILSVLAVVSDKLFVFYFSLPALIFALLHYLNKDKRMVIRFTFLSIAPVFFGVFIFRLLKWSKIILFTSPNRNIGIQGSLDSLSVMKGQFIDYMTAWDMRSFFILLALLSLVLIVFIVVKDWRKPFLSSLYRGYFFFLLINAVLVTLIPIVAGNYIGYDALRYTITVLYFLLFTLPLVFYIVAKSLDLNMEVRWLSSTVLVIGSISLGLLGYVHLNKDGLNAFLNYYPENVRKMDEIAIKEGLKKGIGGYWSAHYFTMLSREGIRIYPSDDELMPFYHGINTKLYFDEASVFNFVLLDQYIDQEHCDKRLKSKGELLENEGVKVIKYLDFRYSKEGRKPYFINP